MLATVPNPDGVQETMLLLQAVEVLEVGGADHPGRITLAVALGDAERTAHARNEGNLTLSLRNEVDLQQSDGASVVAAEVVGRERKRIGRNPVAAAEHRPAARDGSLFVLHGSEVEERHYTLPWQWP